MKYGGIKLYHGADTEVFNPKKFNKQLLREKWGIPRDRKIILFAGTPRPHKGLDDLIRALNIIDLDGNVNLLIVGGSIEGSIDFNLYESNKKRIIYLGYQPHALMPEILHLSDLVVLPQKDIVGSSNKKAQEKEQEQLLKSWILALEEYNRSGNIIKITKKSQLLERILEDQKNIVQNLSAK